MSIWNRLRSPSLKVRRFYVVMLSVGMSLVIFGAGYGLGHRDALASSSGVPAVVNTLLGKPNGVDFGEFWKVYNQVSADYAGGNVDQQQLVYGAIKGMVASLGDPYSLFLTPDEQASFFSSLNGNFDGIGAEVGQDDAGHFVIIAPLDGSPAAKAGLKPQDRIVAVDGKDIGEKTLEDVVTSIRGNKGTTVTITILTSGEAKTHDVTITRDNIVVPSVTSKLNENGIGQIRISQFGNSTGADTRKAAEDLKNKGAKGIILDLRSNPGGFLTGAVDVASLWLPSGSTVVTEQPKTGEAQTYTATGDPVLGNLPTAVLVDKGSASASEIVAGALEDSGKARLFGQTTFGKGSVQTVSELPDKAALRLTIAKWLTPKGRSIQHQGITPDQTIELPSNSDTNQDKDPVNDAATAWILGQLNH